MSNPPKSSAGRARGSPSDMALVRVHPQAKADDKRAAVIAAIRATGLPPRSAALSVGVSSSAYYRLAEDPTFVAAIDEATAVFARRMSAVIARAAATLGSWRAAAFWLERRMPESYGAKLDLRVETEPDEEDRLSDKYPTSEALDAAIADLRRKALANMSPADLEAALEAEIASRKERAT